MATTIKELIENLQHAARILDSLGVCDACGSIVLADRMQHCRCGDHVCHRCGDGDRCIGCHAETSARAEAALQLLADQQAERDMMREVFDRG